MRLKRLLSKILAAAAHRQISKWANNPFVAQERVFKELIRQGQKTQFGRDHNFDQIRTSAHFAQQVPVRDYEGLRHYVDQMVDGAADILWPGRPLYYAKTSGTTSGAKYIPITKASMPHHITNAKNALLCYIHQTKKTQFVDKKMIFLQGSPVLSDKNGVKLGRLSGIAAHYVPSYLQSNRLPSWPVNCMEDWEAKVAAIVLETKDQDMGLISGIPSWVQMYFEKLNQTTQKTVGQLFPNFDLFVYGGVNFAPYRQKFEALIGRTTDSIELYPASEGFFAFQDQQGDAGLLLQLDSGIYYEFIKTSEFFDQSPTRQTLKSVEKGVDYVMIISTNAGLWGYNIGDTVAFTSLKPFKIRVTGRLKHFISAFGEHVIGKEVEQAMTKALSATGASITEFTVAPQITPEDEELPYHQWLIEFDTAPENMAKFAEVIDADLQGQNVYYADLIQGKVLQPLKITALAPNSFNQVMKASGKLGGQNKVPRLSNDRTIAEALLKLQDK
ncbi:MAG: GH3 auxin-responsive promoter family protein [Flavobacteriaceae bacterium]|nr:GH3 auxin-responsive promoter family protein [Flavobacteriaceae bacterium]MDG1962601.1 GH3 auxin-responsive promoter family protein [Flavobacteriaceae bacterium]